MRRLVLATAFAAIFSMCSFVDSFAQENDYEEDYIAQAIAYIRQIEAAYNQARDYLFNGKGTNEDSQKAYQNLAELTETILGNEPPTTAAAIHQQLLFASYRCQNFVIPAMRVSRDDLSNIFMEILVSQLREYCIVQINETKLRLLDYASLHTVNLFADLNEPIVITYTTPVTTSEPITEETESTISSFNAGDAPIIYDVKWWIESAEDLGNSMSMGSSGDLKFKTSGRFILVTLLLENVGNVPVSLRGWANRDLQVVLVDNRSRIFAQFDTGYQLDELCNYAEINPGLSTTCVIPYEVPVDSPGLSLSISLDKDGELQEALIPLDRKSTEEPAEEAVQDTFESGALGLDRSEFEKSHTETGKDIMGTIYDDSLIIMFSEEKVQYIEQQFPAGSAITPEEGEQIGESLIPADAQLIETYTPEGRPETTVKLYMSESLKSRFDFWPGGEPGNFIVQYKTFDGVVAVLLISTGNNP